MTRPHIKSTVDDYMALPDSAPRQELIGGSLYVVPSPSIDHQDVLRRLFSALDSRVGSHGDHGKLILEVGSPSNTHT